MTKQDLNFFMLTLGYVFVIAFSAGYVVGST